MTFAKAGSLQSALNGKSQMIYEAIAISLLSLKPVNNLSKLLSFIKDV
jgi:hypothetical protein